jgi:dihydrofolate synthase/folylpolyglutamate synthase
LRAAGHRAGRYTSPHLHSWRERIVVDGRPIDEDAFADLLRRALAAAESIEREEPGLGRATSFELLTAMALDEFARAECDFAVVEVGLGGTYDATNVVSPLVAVITRIDYEHTNVLGRTLPEIAANKAGILKPGRPAVVSPQGPEVLATIESVAAERECPLLVGGRDWQWAGSWRGFGAIGPWGRIADLTLGLVGGHQVENACTALAALWCLRERGVAIPETAIREGFSTARWPGRFERLSQRRAPDVIFDGAHTGAAAAALAATLDEELPGLRPIVVIGTSSDKDPADLGKPLSTIATAAIATRSRGPRATDPAVIATALQTAGIAVDVAPTVAEAIERAKRVAGPKGLILVTGSLYVVAEAREFYGLATSDPAFD